MDKSFNIISSEEQIDISNIKRCKDLGRINSSYPKTKRWFNIRKTFLNAKLKQNPKISDFSQRSKNCMTDINYFIDEFINNHLEIESESEIFNDEQIMEKYEKIINDNRIHAINRYMFSNVLGQAYANTNHMKRSREIYQIGRNLYKETFGDSSKDFQLFKSDVLYIHD